MAGHNTTTVDHSTMELYSGRHENNNDHSIHHLTTWRTLNTLQYVTTNMEVHRQLSLRILGRLGIDFMNEKCLNGPSVSLEWCAYEDCMGSC